MKDEKLKLMLNKVVEYNNPKANKGKGSHFKAFLYKNYVGYYYFKVVEVVNDDKIGFNDIIQLKKGDDKFIIIADKPKLMRVSKNSWHYKLMKYVLGGNAPTPRDMQNGCPYFWLLIFSVLVVPFKLVFEAIKWTVLLIPNALFSVLEVLVNSWIEGLDDEAAYDMYWGISDDTKMPKTAKMYFDNTNDNFFDYFLSKKYKDIDKNDPKYQEKRQEIREKWEVWRADLEEKREELRKINIEREKELRKKQVIRDAKRREFEAKWDARMKPISVGFANMGQWFKKTFTVERGRVNMIVKRTKQFVGAIVTLSTLVATFFAVNYISLALMVAADWCINHWQIFVGLAAVAVLFGILYLLYVLITSWLQGVVNKYELGKKIWYIEPFIYLVWYPVKYFALATAFIAINIIWIPLKFIFYTILFKYFLKPIGLGIGRGTMNIIKGIGSSSGIFGEYFGASYSDYCPGIEWTDFDEQ